MPNRLGVWEIRSGRPERILDGQIVQERDLEDWIVADPALIQAGLVVVARQLVLGEGRLDLLAIDLQGRWVIIEIKRGELYRDALLQALDYASSLTMLSGEELERRIDPRSLGHDKNLRDLLKERGAEESLDPENRDISIIVVGAGRSAGLERLAGFLAGRYRIPLTIVSFQVFATSGGQQVLVRELEEGDEVSSGVAITRRTPTVDELLGAAHRNGIGDSFQELYDLATSLGLYPRTWKSSIMFTPPMNRTRCLFTVWTDPVGGKLVLYPVPAAFSEFYSIGEQRVVEHIGQGGWRHASREDVSEFAAGLRGLFREISEGAISEENSLQPA